MSEIGIVSLLQLAKVKLYFLDPDCYLTKEIKIEDIVYNTNNLSEYMGALLGAVLELDNLENNPLFLGSFSLPDNEGLSQILLARYAEKVENFPTFAEYLALFKSLKFDLKEPKITDEKFNIFDPNIKK